MAPLQVRQQPVKLHSKLQQRLAPHIEQNILRLMMNDLIQYDGQPLSSLQDVILHKRVWMVEVSTVSAWKISEENSDI